MYNKVLTGRKSQAATRFYLWHTVLELREVLAKDIALADVLHHNRPMPRPHPPTVAPIHTWFV